MTFTGVDSSEEEEVGNEKAPQKVEQTRRQGAAHQPAILRSASIADAQALMEESKEGPSLADLPRGSADDGGGVFVKYKVNETGVGDPSVEVRLEPLWRRSTLVDLAKAAKSRLSEGIWLRMRWRISYRREI